MEQKAITISDARLREAAGQGMDEFLQVFIDRYKEVIGGELNAENMGMLNGEQISLLAYSIFREEVMDGGFIQLIYILEVRMPRRPSLIFCAIVKILKNSMLFCKAS